jgi:hypothetical protein
MTSIFEAFLMQPWLTAQIAVLEAAPTVARQRLQQVWATFSPHFSAHFLSLSSHPFVALHLAY